MFPDGEIPEKLPKEPSDNDFIYFSNGKQYFLSDLQSLDKRIDSYMYTHKHLDADLIPEFRKDRILIPGKICGYFRANNWDCANLAVLGPALVLVYQDQNGLKLIKELENFPKDLYLTKISRAQLLKESEVESETLYESEYIMLVHYDKSARVYIPKGQTFNEVWISD